MRILLPILFTALASQAQTIIPLDRVPVTNSIPWSPGIPGGIPSYSSNNSVLTYGADNTGANPSDTAFANAISACGNGQYIWIPAGTYKLNSAITIANPHQIELRGAGPTNTIINSYDNSGRAVLDFTSGGIGATYTSISSGYDRGSVSIVVSSAAGFTSNGLMHIKQGLDSGIAPGTGESSVYQIINQLVTITNISGTTIKFTPPLYCSYRSGLSPQAGYWSTTPVKRSGARDFTINVLGTLAGSQNGVRFWGADQCWVYNLIVSNSPHSSILVDQSKQCVVKHCYTINHQFYDSNERYSVLVTHFGSDHLIEDNIGAGNNLAFVPQQGASGCVFAYNFSDRGYGNGYPTATDMRDGYEPHGTASQFCLGEGNVVQNIVSDDFWGCNLTNTYFRNWATCENRVNLSDALSTSGNALWNKGSTQLGMSWIGNVLSKFAGGSMTMYSVAGTYDFLHGNYDFVSQSAQWSNSISQTLPSSYYLASKPDFFGNLPWPAIGPDVATNRFGTVSNHFVIPAQQRYVTGADPSPVDFTLSGPNDATVNVGDPASFTVSPTGGLNYSFQWVRNGVNINGAGSSIYTLSPTVSGDNNAQFYCNVSDASGTLPSRTATLTVIGGGAGSSSSANSATANIGTIIKR